MAKIETLFPLTFSSSVLDDISCEFFFFRRYCQKLLPLRSSGDLLAGSLFAQACERVRKGYHDEGKDVDLVIEEAQEFILNSPSTEHAIKTNENVSLCLKKYFKKFPVDSTLQPAPLSDGTHAIEYFFEFDTGISHPDIPERNITLSGKLDGLYQISHLGKVAKRYVLDEKTASSLFRVQGTSLVDFAKEESFYKTRGQFLLYHYAARQLGVNTDSTLVRKVPLFATYEPAIELEIPITNYQIEMYINYVYCKIEELKQKYIWWLENDTAPAQMAFYPVYNHICNSFARVCEYQEGCLYKEGEQVLTQSHKQAIWNSEKNILIDLKEYKELIKAGKL